MAVKKSKKKVTGKTRIKKKRALKKKTAKRRSARAVKKPLKPKRTALAVKKAQGEGVVLGLVTHYFPKVRAAVVKLKTPLSIGDNVRIKGHTTDFTQSVSSIQIDHVPINSAKKGQEIGLLVNSRVRQNDIVYKV